MKNHTYRLMMLTSASPVFYPDDPPPLVAAPELPTVEDAGDIIPPKEGDPPKEPAEGDPPKAGDPEPKPKGEEPPAKTAEELAAEEAAKVPEAYTLTAGEGVELDAKMVEQATPIFKELGLNNEQAQKIVTLYADTVLPEVAQTVQNQTLALLGMDGMANWAKDAKADKEIGGANFTQSMALAATVRDNDKLVTPELRAILETSRLGNHPELLRLFARVGKALGESPVHSESSGKTEVTGAELFYGPAFAPKS